MTDDDGPEGDALPEDLDVTAYVGPYTFPDIKRRRIAGTIYAVMAVLCLAAGLASDNSGFLLAAGLLGVTAIYHFLAAYPLRIDQTDALARRESRRRVPGRPCVGAARLAGAPQPPDLAHPALQRRRTAEHPRTRAARRSGRARARGIHRAEPRRLVAHLGDPRRRGASVSEFFRDFRKFIIRGNIVDLAVAVIIGVAFNAVVQSFVNDVVSPIIGAVFGKPDFNSLTFKLGDGVIAYGAFLTAVLNFVIIAFVVFIILTRVLRTCRRASATRVEEEAEKSEKDVLVEIRDLLGIATRRVTIQCARGADLVGEVCGHRVVVRVARREPAAPARHRTEIDRVAQDLGGRDRRDDLDLAATYGRGTLDAAPLAVQIAHDVALIRFGHGDDQFRDGFEQHRARPSASLPSNRARPRS